MSANVYANGREVSAKKSDNESIAAMPDVCLSPPSPPVGPIPIPYPNFSNASDTAHGTKSVKIAGDEAGIKDQSNYKTSKGDEAATKSLGMGIVTHSIQGKTYFAAWSSDVMFEGANAVRFMDLTTHNHACDPANPPSAVPNKGMMSPKPTGDPQCVELEEEMQKAAREDTKEGKVKSGQVMATSKHSKVGFMKSASESLMKNGIKSEALASYLPRPKRVTIKGKRKEPTIACTSDRYNGWTCNSGHAEGKMIQNIFEKTASMGGTLTLRIRWNYKGKIRQQPCPACKSAICKTAQKCKMKIELCTKRGSELRREAAPCQNGKWRGAP